MKQTFSHKLFDWILIVISLIFSVLTIMNLAGGFEYLSSYFLRIVYSLASVTALISLLVFKMNGERFSRIFILVTLIIPAILVLNLYLTDLFLYGINRMNLLQNPVLFLKLLCGLFLIYFTIKFSKQHKTEQIKDYGILVVGIGIFAICYVLILTAEPLLKAELNNYPVWKTISKSIIGIVFLIFGVRIKSQKISFRNGLIWTMFILFIFGLV